MIDEEELKPVGIVTAVPERRKFDPSGRSSLQRLINVGMSCTVRLSIIVSSTLWLTLSLKEGSK